MIPDYQAFMLPLLRAVSDGQDHRTSELIPGLADAFGVSAEERAELLPSGRTPVIYSRVQWARTFMKQAGLLEAVGRGIIRITEEGRQALAQNPTKIDLSFLRGYPAFVDFENRSKSAPGEPALSGPPSQLPAAAAETPEETLNRVWRQLRSRIATELLDILRDVSPAFFEDLVVRLLVAMGYGGTYADAAAVVGRSGDGGIDGIIKEDRLGLDAVYVQAKRWTGPPVGRPSVQAFAGSLEAHRGARKGVMITTSSFTAEARAYVGQIGKSIVLIDGATLADLMIEYGVGITTDRTYAVPRIDLDFFDEQP